MSLVSRYLGRQTHGLLYFAHVEYPPFPDPPPPTERLQQSNWQCQALTGAAGKYEAHAD